MSNKERRKIEKVLRTYESILRYAEKHGQRPPDDVVCSVELLREKLREG